MSGSRPRSGQRVSSSSFKVRTAQDFERSAGLSVTVRPVLVSEWFPSSSSNGVFSVATDVRVTRSNSRTLIYTNADLSANAASRLYMYHVLCMLQQTCATRGPERLHLTATDGPYSYSRSRLPVPFLGSLRCHRSVFIMNAFIVNLPYLVSQTSFSAIITTLACTAVVILLSKAVYNVYLHPLAALPIPSIWAPLTILWTNYRIIVTRDKMYVLDKLYRTTGKSVVRVGPKEITVCDPEVAKRLMSAKWDKVSAIEVSQGFALMVIEPGIESFWIVSYIPRPLLG